MVRISTTIVLLVLLALPSRIFSQNTEQAEPSDTKLMNAAREIMAASGTCTLITLDESDQPMVRIMDPFPPESDFTVWFGTNENSRKVTQIKNNPVVTLYYADSDNSGYVVIHGKAQLVDDQNEKKTRWKEEWNAFYPNRPEGYLLIKVFPEWMEVLSYSRGITGDPSTWQPPAVFFDSIK